LKVDSFNSALKRDHPYHIIRFSWMDFRPVLIAYDLREHEIVELDLWELDWRVTDRRICVGKFTGNGYEPCPAQRPVFRFSQCVECAFIPDLECIFEPKCGGDYCKTEFCSRDHVVYLAFFGPVMKVGMTGAHRLRERLIEQGADAYTVLALAGNRWAARGLEKEIAAELELRQIIPGKKALEIMHTVGSPEEAARKAFREFIPRADRSVLEGCGERFLRSLTVDQMTSGGISTESDPGELFDFGNSMKNLEIISDYPIELPLEAMPVNSLASGIHSGRVVGMKGKFLIYDSKRGPGLTALQLSMLESRLIWL